MQINDIKQILEISESEWIYFSNFINQQIKTTILVNMPFLNKNKNLQSISLYSLYPLLFRKEFKLFGSNLENLIVFSHNHFMSLFILDKIYDSQKIYEPIDLLVLLEQYSNNKSFLKSLNIEDDTFISENITKTLYGLYKEKYVYKYNKILTHNEEIEYAYDKYSFAKIALKVFNLTSGYPINEKVFEELCLSHNYFSYGRQILDDIEDFSVDFDNNHFNIYTNRYFFETNSFERPLFKNSIFIDLLLESKKYFYMALDVLSIDFKLWRNYINFYISICDRYL